MKNIVIMFTLLYMQNIKINSEKKCVNVNGQNQR